MVAIFFAYFITGRLGIGIESVSSFATLIWPPSGIALAAFLLYGYRVWPAVAAAAFVVNVSFGSSLPIALLIAAGNTLGPAAGAYLLNWYRGYNVYHPGVPRLRDNTGIVIIAFLVPVITSTLGAMALWSGAYVADGKFWETWLTWWVGDALGILIFTPFILKWFNKPLFERTRQQQIEMALVLVAVALTAYLIFWMPDFTFAYYLFLPLTWAALRTGPRGVTLSIVLASAIATAGTFYGSGPFIDGRFFSLQLFLGSMAAVFLIFTAAVEERRNVLEALKQHTSELETALVAISSEDEAKKEFLAVLAHEMRNPLATILSSIELINLQGISAPNSQMLLGTINERANAMVRLLDDLLDMSRVSQKKLVLRKEVVSVERSIEKLAPTIQQLIQKYGHEISVRKPEQELFLDADPMRLEQIFINLLTNAAKYTKSPGLIEIIVERVKDEVHVHIRDNGVGIPRNMLGRIFEPYFQINRNREGIGIGLPLTRQLVEMHGGTIEARSKGPNKGSDFVVRLPLMLDVEPQSSPAVSLVSALRGGARSPRHVKRAFKILVVDDNRTATDALARLLQLKGHTTAVAYTGTEGVKKAYEFSPDIVILDIGLPDIDGYEVAAKLRKQKKRYYLIALTGYGQAEDKEKARQAGFHRHLTKPAGFKELEGVLRRIPRSVSKW